MASTHFLVLSTRDDLLEVMLRLIRNHEGWTAEGATSPDEARQKFAAGEYDIFLLNAGIEAATEAALEAEFKAQQPGLIVIQHYGGGSGLLYNEVQAALDAQKADSKG